MEVEVEVLAAGQAAVVGPAVSGDSSLEALGGRLLLKALFM